MLHWGPDTRRQWRKTKSWNPELPQAAPVSLDRMAKWWEEEIIICPTTCHFFYSNTGKNSVLPPEANPINEATLTQLVHSTSPDDQKENSLSQQSYFNRRIKYNICSLTPLLPHVWAEIGPPEAWLWTGGIWLSQCHLTHVPVGGEVRAPFWHSLQCQYLGDLNVQT